MGIPKFFRWISERYPKINKRHTVLPGHALSLEHLGEPLPVQPLLEPDPLSKCGLAPPIDRLYVDMNGILHGCSHNNSTDEQQQQQQQRTAAAAGVDDGSAASAAGAGISREEIFDNVCYYLDRLVKEIAQPNELIYLAIDGVAPRAKLNQQRSRRYRSSTGGEIEESVYAAHMERKREIMDQQQQEDHSSSLSSYRSSSSSSSSSNPNVEGVMDDLDDDDLLLKKNSANDDENNAMRLSGKFETHTEGQSSSSRRSNKGVKTNSSSSSSSSKPSFDDYQQQYQALGGMMNASSSTSDSNRNHQSFHSNEITPGTEFFQECQAHLEHFIQYKMTYDPQWQKLTVILSGSNVPGEGEHKLMDFIRREQQRPDYNPNLRHCMVGQDGDLILLALATHEPNMVLLRERVLFDRTRRDLVDASGIRAAYVHNCHYEFLHVGILREYLGYDLEAKPLVPTSQFDLERTIDDFVFMTFFCGNDFLPHIPAMDIGDEAFDLLFHTYKKERRRWRKNKGANENNHNCYLTHAGTIVSGQRLERFLTALGQHETVYLDNKKESSVGERHHIRRMEEKYGETPTVPSDDLVEAKETSDREAYRTMMTMMNNSSTTKMMDGSDSDSGNQTDTASDDGAAAAINGNSNNNNNSNRSSTFRPVLSVPENLAAFKGDEGSEDEEDYQQSGLMKRMGSLLEISIGDPSKTKNSNNNKSSKDYSDADTDIKGRYYYDKFKFTPFDEEKHLALRKAYIEGLVWNLKYYYEGCVSWEWYYPYHYGPMLSDLVDIDSHLKDVSFQGKMGKPLDPFQQLMGCMPPSSAYLLPQPYRWLLTDEESPIHEFYPQSFTVDMNGKRWHWEGVVLLPFIDSKRLIDAANTHVTNDVLSADEVKRNSRDKAYVFTHDPNQTSTDVVPALGTKDMFAEIKDSKASIVAIEESTWDHQPKQIQPFQPKLQDDVVHPVPGYPTLASAPIFRLLRRYCQLNIFNLPSKYRTALLVLSQDLPEFPPTDTLAKKFIGTTIHINYPHLQEAFVTAVSDSKQMYRGPKAQYEWNEKERIFRNKKLQKKIKELFIGEKITGSGGFMVGSCDTSFSVRPLEGLMTMKDGTLVRRYAKFEMELPLTACIWSPSQPDPRLQDVPAALEKNPYFVGQAAIWKEKMAMRRAQKEADIAARLEKVVPSDGGGTGTRQITSRSFSTYLAPNVGMMMGRTSSILRPQLNSRLIKSNITLNNPRSFISAALPTAQMMEAPLLLTQQQAQPTILRPARVQIPSVARRRTGRWGVAALALGFTAVASMLGCTTATRVPMNSNVISPPVLFRGGGDTSSSGVTFVPETGTVMSDDMSKPTPPPLEFEHGTTTLSFIFDGGIIAAVDSRASLGNFVGSKTVHKVLPIHSHMLGTMAGGAADCSYWIRQLRAEAALYEVEENGERMSVARASKILANNMYAFTKQGSDELSVGTMIMGICKDGTPEIYYVDNTGARIKGNMFSVGSGSTFAYGILDSEYKHDMTEDEAIALGIKAIRHATFRDAYSGGYIGVYLINRNGWSKVFSQDLAAVSQASLPNRPSSSTSSEHKTA